MKIKKLNEFLNQNREKKFRLKQILKSVFKEGVDSFLDITTLPDGLRNKLNNEMEILPFKSKEVFVSQKKDSYKALLELSDGKKIETVLMRQSDDRWSACVSSQVGCGMGCAFCATGHSGFKRNLSREEIGAQLLFWKQYLRKHSLPGHVTNVVFMGMGEPFMNYAEVKEAITDMLDPDLFNLSARHISVSTSGLPNVIKQFAKDFPQVNLAISLISANNRKRSELMLINRKYDLDEIRNVLNYYFLHNNRKVFLEYVMFSEVNDGKVDADDLVNFVKSVSRPDLLHVNLISYNETVGKLRPVAKHKLAWFEEYLGKNRMSVTVRRSVGGDICAACGQLAGN